MANALALEKSPYLRQHAGNPVDWLPWGEEAFAKARALDRPVFLSIGYSTCHWCHVMARESFENGEIAALLNEHFVSIKVDREERPDVDRVYMAYVQSATGHGGWPLSVWLTPEQKPFYGGTYFPPDNRYGRPGFGTILEALARGWREDRPKFLEAAEEALGALRAPRAAEPAAGEGLHQAGSSAYSDGFRFFEQSFDRVRGGFGGAPKFPRASNLAFLFRCAALQGPESEEGDRAARMAVETLTHMSRGGIHDHVGGGFHRYSVDGDWFVPHFEKMLYDQAQIAVNAIEAWQATGDERHAWLVRDILDYVLRDLADPAGGFHSAEDADSAEPSAEPSAHGGLREGAFYVWTRSQIEEALGPDAELFCGHFGVEADGNVPAERDPHGEFAGRNILAQTGTLARTARAAGLDLQEASDRIAAALEKLRSVRAGRPRPGRDDKILAAWNGLAISAFSRAAASPAAALGERRAANRAAAVGAAESLRARLWEAAGERLFRCWRGGRSPVEGFAEDYALLIQGLLDLYESVFDARWLQWAERLQARMDALFWDESLGGYFNSAASANVPVRLKDDYDGAEPAANSVAAMNLLRLAGLFGEAGGAWKKRGEKVLEAYRPLWSRQPHLLPQMLCSLELALMPPRQLVLAGDSRAADFRALADVASEQLAPRFAVLAADGGEGQAWLGSRAPWIAAMAPSGAKATAFYCEGFCCRAPVTRPEELRGLLYKQR